MGFAFCLIKLHLRGIPLWHADGLRGRRDGCVARSQATTLCFASPEEVLIRIESAGARRSPTAETVPAPSEPST
jgi:hypothetical protein